MSGGSESRLSEVLSSGVVLTALRCGSLHEALQSLLGPALEKEGLTPDAVQAVFEAVEARERIGSTSIGPVAVPHARVPGLKRIVGGLGINPGGVFDGNRDERLVLAFASPAQTPADHLRFLGRLAQVFRDEEARTLILAAPGAEAVLAAIRARER